MEVDGQLHASAAGRFTPWEGATGTHLIGSWMGSKAGLYAVVKRNYPGPYRESNRRRLARSPATILAKLSITFILIKQFL